ncbi:hypothetical protein J2T12_003566 [Paenibacillus anaericanus]|uniref:hypothetical protein n=1 Tax=Paenibacillus anaericanus TaxID=170367 RepID=UPI00277EDA21|nr:hypothetical protein [Paenibacillus anaericanus]MDQ0090152.1 hypothetical protein [Paenibacillus anaericanus]
MNGIRTIYHIARADLLERIRQYSFLVTLGITMLVAYIFVPPADAGFVTLYFDKYRGIYNSAWVGGAVALSTTLFLSLFGFYLVKNSILRDERTRVGQIIASTSVKKFHYLLGKALSNFAVLSIIVFFILIVALIMQVVRGEVMQVELWQLLSPFVFMALPVMAVVAALAVLFETRPVLQGGLGNVLYFFLYIIIGTSSSFSAFGTEIITSDMMNEVVSIHPDFTGSYSIGILVLEQPLELFEWQGVEWTAAIMQQRALYFILAFLVIMGATLLFRGFKEDSIKVKKESGSSQQVVRDPAVADLIDNDKGESFQSIQVADLTPVKVRKSFLALVFAEWRLMMSGASMVWFGITSILIILCILLPASSASQGMIGPIAWIWPLMLWSGIGSREARHQTYDLVASTPRFVIRQLSAVWVSAVMLTCLTGSGMAIRFILEVNVEALAYWVAGVILIPSLALASGVLTKTNRTFEVLYMIIWYLGPFNKMPFLNFMGEVRTTEDSWVAGVGLNAWSMSFIYILIGIGALLLAYMSRKRWQAL